MIGLTTKEKELKLQLEEELYWVHNRRVLLLSDSVDRYMTEYMCEELHGVFAHGPAGFQTTASCHIVYLNFTIMHWHVSSTYTSLPPWWWTGRTKIVAFEERLDEYFEPTVRQIIGKNGQSPDVVILQSGLWDQSVFALAYNQMLVDQGKAKQLSKTMDLMRSLNWEEMNFYMHRIARIVELVRMRFGHDVPFLYRSMTHLANGSATMSIYDMERGARFVCQQLSVEYMEFGSLISGHYDMYRDKVHLQDGPLSALWGNMVMWYLFRTQGGLEYRGDIQRMPPKSITTDSYNHSIGKAWKECHDVYMQRILV
ncbi:hypothetical protein V1504DRAFT_397591 [Lipomyces starkeyi]